MKDLFTGGARYSRGENGTVTDLSKLERVDSIFEFSRARLRDVHINPKCDASFRLSERIRDRVHEALDNVTLMIR